LTKFLANVFLRSHGIRRNRPITIQVTPDSPSLHEPEEIGLQYLASIFRPFDEVFFAIWNGSSNDCSKEWLLRLESRVRNALPDALEVSSEQIANLRVSQLWLQVKLFELSPRFGFLSSESGHECLTFGYPIVLARELIILAMKLPIGSLQIHGVGMVRPHLASR
jgi:SP family general alpha glucoside:H+ symporter-like MFS transporter